jgi:hypothetical protein
MRKKDREKQGLFRSLGEWHICVLLVLTNILVRIPFLGAFDLVSYDGTYYINHARFFLDRAFGASGFPVGYPAAIAVVFPLLRDGVRAAQAVSLLAGIGSIALLYFLCRHFVERRHAVAAGLLFAFTPLYIRLSMMTMSESLYIFLLLGGLLLYAGDRDLLSGLLFGAAACTRPEAIGIFGILALLRIRRPRRLLAIIGGFALVYAASIILQSYTAGRLVLLPKARLFGTSASYWKLREGWIDFSGQQQAMDEVAGERERLSILADYLKRMPSELLLLARHASPVLFLLGLYGMIGRRTFIMTALVPFLFFVPFTFRSEPRFILPYIPILCLYAMVGVERFKKASARNVALVLAALSFAAAFFINADQLTTPVSEGYAWTKELGRRAGVRIEPGATIADRKPFFAFYAGGRYVEIPVGPYDETIEHLYERGVEYLLLDPSTLHRIRPRLRPLLYDEAVIQGELRYTQVSFHGRVAALMRRNPGSASMSRRYLFSTEGGYIRGPVWSPDGLKIAYRMIGSSGEGGIYVITRGGGSPMRIVKERGTEDSFSWSPDSKSIAYANDSGGNMDLYVINLSGEIYQLTSHEGADSSPSWSHDGREIVFSSDRTGSSEIWSKDLETGRLSRLSRTGGASHPAVSPDGRTIAFIRKGTGLFLLDRASGAEKAVRAPRLVYSAPSWSPDGRSIAVTAKDWGKTDVYLVTGDGERSLLVTKGTDMVGHSSWSPDGASFAAVSVTDRGMSIVIIDGVEPYVNRLLNPVPARAFAPPE